MADYGTRLLNPWMLHLQKMELELKCPLCLNLLDQPTLLPCDHIFCRSCITSSRELGSDCSICRSSFADSGLRKSPHIENMVKIYRSMNAVIANNCFPSLSQATSQGGQKNGIMNRKANISPAMQTSPASPPSFGEKGSDDDGSNIGGQNSCRRCPTENVVEEIVDGTSTKVCGRPSPQGQKGPIREPKRQKLDFGLEMSASSGFYSRSTYLDSENKFMSKSDMRHKVEPLSNSQQSGTSGGLNANQAFICAFCKSSRESEASGPMVHYADGKSVVADELGQDNVLHVHRKCAEWAPLAYFDEDQTLHSLKEEIDRAAKLKCSSCGLKGAALGCSAKSCKKTFHVPCAVNVVDCRWDCEDFNMLCPAHASFKFPKERSKSLKSHGRNHSSVTQVPTPESSEVRKTPLGLGNEVVCSGPAASRQSYNAWKSSPGRSNDWVVCGSALSSAEKTQLTKFEKISGATNSKGWQPNVTHVIAGTDEEGACSRTFKVLMAILNGKWVLKFDWIKACMENMGPVAEEPYEVGLDNYGCCDGPKNGRLRIMDKVGPKLFNGHDFYFIGDFEPSYKGNLEELVLAAGGTVLNILTVDSLTSQAGSKRVIVYNLQPMLKNESKDDTLIVSPNHKEAKALGDQTGSWVVAHTWILESIAGCKLQCFSQ